MSYVPKMTSYEQSRLQVASVSELTPKAEALRERIVDLESAITEFIAAIDKVMVGPSTHERGRRIAGLIGALQFTLDERGPQA